MTAQSEYADRALVLDLLRAEGALFTHKQPARPPVRPVVYYLLWADRIKIGFSTRLAERIRGIYHDEVLAVEPGSFELEQARHRQFAEYRLPRQREWFSDVPALRFHINTLRDQYPNLIRSFV